MIPKVTHRFPSLMSSVFSRPHTVPVSNLVHFKTKLLNIDIRLFSTAKWHIKELYRAFFFITNSQHYCEEKYTKKESKCQLSACRSRPNTARLHSECQLSPWNAPQQSACAEHTCNADQVPAPAPRAVCGCRMGLPAQGAAAGEPCSPELDAAHMWVVCGCRMVPPAQGVAAGEPCSPKLDAGHVWGAWLQNGAASTGSGGGQSPLPETGRCTHMRGAWLQNGAASAGSGGGRTPLPKTGHCTPGLCIMRRQMSSPHLFLSPPTNQSVKNPLSQDFLHFLLTTTVKT